MSLTQTVYDQLKAQIIRADQAPGEIIYEADLAQEFGVSRTPIREALTMLVQTGWVVVLPRKGYLVRPVELSDVREIFAFRRMIEPSLAEEAAATATDDLVARLDGVVARQADAHALGEALEAAREFHLALADIFGSQRVRTTLSDLVDEVRRLHYLLPNVEDHITSADELRAHREIVDAIRIKDGTAARKLMASHLNEVAHTLVKGFAGV